MHRTRKSRVFCFWTPKGLFDPRVYHGKAVQHKALHDQRAGGPNSNPDLFRELCVQLDTFKSYYDNTLDCYAEGSHELRAVCKAARHAFGAGYGLQEAAGASN